MSDNFKHDDPIEELFRKKAEEYDIPFLEADWMDLEERLIRRGKQHAARKRMHWLAAASVLILSLLGYFTYENYVQLQQLSQQINRPFVPEGYSTSPETDIHTPSSDHPNGEGEQPGLTSTRNDDFRQHNPPSAHKQDQRIRTTTDAAFRKPIRSEYNLQAPFPVKVESGQTLVVTDFQCDPCLLADKVPLPQAPYLSSHVRSIDAGNTYTPPEVRSGGRSVASAQTAAQGIHDDSRIALGIILAPDMSTVGSLSNFYDPGYKFGLAFEYRISPTVSLTTGIIQSRIRYVADGDEYSPSYNYWKSGSLPYQTVGECLLLDIPISIKLNFLPFGRSRLYASAGVSSYIMLTEQYDFRYSYGSGETNNSWSGNTGTAHWLSNAGFSLGYEHDLNSKWGLRVEPFLRIPLKEVGWGNVKLYSVGSFISINYKL